MDTEERSGRRQHVARRKTAEVKRFSDERVAQFEKEQTSRREGDDERPRSFGSRRNDEGRSRFGSRDRKFGEKSEGGWKPREDRDENRESRGTGRRSFEGKKFSDRKFDDRKSDQEGSERKSFGDRKFGDRDRKFGDRDRKFGDRDRKFGDRDRKFGDRDRKFGDENSEGRHFNEEGSERRSFRDRRSDDRKFGDRKFGDRDRKFGDRKFGDRKFSDRKFDDRKPDEEGSERRDFGDRKFGDRKFGDRKFGDKKFGDRKFGDRKFGDRKFDDRPRRHDFDSSDNDNQRFDRSEHRGGGFRRREKDPLYDRPKASGEIRLNKYLADSGICSRREADDLILAGAVTVNGEVVKELGTKVNPSDKVVYGGETLNREKLRYVLLNKPKGVITTSDDPYERHTVMELVEGACEERIYPVGRLDRNTIGLLLLTNDGELAKTLTHPSHEVKKLYHVTLDKPLTKNDLQKITDGIELEDGPIQVDEIAYVTDDPTKREVGVQIHSGRNHIVRRIFESLGYEVIKLDRVMFAELTKQNLPRGHWRFLTSAEISMLKRIQ